MNALELRSVHTHIGAYHILHGVDFSVPEGEVTVLLGRNGAGKTTTLRTIMGLWPASDGDVQFRGQSMRGHATPDVAGLGIAYVPESMGIFTDLTVQENMVLAARGARIQVFGVANPGATASIRPEEIFAKELTILGSVINPSTHHRAVELLPTLGLERLGILTFPLEQHEEAFRAQHERRAGKVQFTPQTG